VGIVVTVSIEFLVILERYATFILNDSDVYAYATLTKKHKGAYERTAISMNKASRSLSTIFNIGFSISNIITILILL